MRHHSWLPGRRWSLLRRGGWLCVQPGRVYLASWHLISLLSGCMRWAAFLPETWLFYHVAAWSQSTVRSRPETSKSSVKINLSSFKLQVFGILFSDKESDYDRVHLTKYQQYWTKRERLTACPLRVKTRQRCACYHFWPTLVTAIVQFENEGIKLPLFSNNMII